MRFLSVVHSAKSVSHSANVLIVRRGPFTLAESFVHAQNLERTTPDKGVRWMYGSYELACVLSGTRVFFVLYLSSSHPLMSSGPDSGLDYNLKCTRSTGGVPDICSLFSGRLLTRNAWKLTNNGAKRSSTGPN